MFVRHCTSCRYDCKKDEICEKYKRIATNTAGPPEYTDRGRPIGHALLRGKFEAPYHRELREDVPEHNKWIANDYMKLIKKYWRHDEKKAGNLEVLANSILNTYDSFWNNGDPNGKIDENMPEEERQNIYWKKTLTAYPYALLDKINEEKRLYNTMITGVPMEAVNEEPEEDAGKKVEKLFKWISEHLWDLAKDETVEKTYENGKMSRRVIQGTTPEQRRKRFEMALESMRLHYIEQIDYREIAKMFNMKYGQDINGAVLRLFPIIAKHEEEIFS